VGGPVTPAHRVVVVGDALLDRDVTGRAERLSPDAPVPVLEQEEVVARPGGAALAAALAAAGGHPVTLVTALGGDAAGTTLRRVLAGSGVEVVDAGTRGATPEKIRFRAGDRPLLRLDRGGPTTPPGRLPEAARRALAGAGAVLVSDYGRGMTAATDVREAVASVPAPVVWDPHPRGAEPVPGAAVVTPNLRELGAAATSLAAVAARAGQARLEWRAAAVAVTLGSEGALLVAGGGAPLAIPASPAAAGDPCGAGDRFAAAVAGALANGNLLSEAVVKAVAAASRFVAEGGAARVRPGAGHPAPAGGGIPDATGGRGRGLGAAAVGLDAAVAVADRVRDREGTVVATGGCFDVLHAGHLHLLTAARSLGDCLVVCVNSDSSVRRLKGSGRPVVSQSDRVAMLAAGCVDAVVVFDDSTPVPVLERLRPHLFAKGGDYGGRPLPESEALARWGGQVVLVPYLDGRSTTGVLSQLATLRP
jgi:D-beta-D-heptose 7-phosphate kinase/D-beta-D-heptose 1-phosphate adenosyltransferase